VHPRRSHVMPATAQRAGPGVLVPGHPIKQLDPTGPAPAKLPPHHLVERTKRAPVERRQPPVELRARHVQRIAFRAEQDARGRVWRLLRSEEHTSELQSRGHLVCRLLLEKKKRKSYAPPVTRRLW